MNKKHSKTLQAIFERPTSSSVKWQSLVGLMKEIGCEVEEREGSRVGFVFGDDEVVLHKPHPGNELKKYVVEQLRNYFRNKGIKP